MAGAMIVGDEGMEVSKQSVPSIGGEAQVVASAHLNESRAEGVAYPETFGIDRTTSAYPAGTDNGEASNPLRA